MTKGKKGFQPGQKRPEGSGRKPGTLNKKTQALLDIFEEHDYCPAVELIKALKGEPTFSTKLLVLEDDKIADIHMKFMEFKFPKRKAVEHTGNVNNTNMKYEDYLQEIENGESKET